MPSAPPSPLLPIDTLLAVVRDEATRCASLAASVDHGAPLPHLPGWTVGDCIAHLVGDLRWVTAIVSTRAWDPTGIVPAAETGAALVEEFERAASHLTGLLAAAADEPDAACPNFTDRTEGRLGFWPRRQAHELTVHRWDLEVPTGGHAPITADVAADGVDEALHTYTRRYGGQVLGETLVVACTDHPAAWRINPTVVDGDPTRVTVERCDGAHPDLTGPAAGLLLTIEHRCTPDEAGLRFATRELVARAFLDGPLVA